MLGGLLGSGPSGEVYVVAREDAESDRYVVKVIRHVRDLESRLRRFRADIDVLESLRRRDILAPTQFQTLDDEHIAVVLERAEGMPLRSFRGRLSPKTFIEVLERAASLVGEAHAVGCFHGHLHESNIFVVMQDDAVQRVEVGGFGTLHLFDEDAFQPDIIRSDDIFGLGLVAFREVTGAEYRSSEDLQKLIRESATYPVRFCQAIERWLDPVPSRRPQKIRQVVGLLEYALASTDPAKSFPLGLTQGAAPSAAIIRPPKTTISEISDAFDDGGATEIQQAVSWSSGAGRMLWVDVDGVLRLRDDKGDDTVIDTGGSAPSSFGVTTDAVAFAVEGGEVHILEESGIRRVSQLGREAVAVSASAAERILVAATVDGRVWYKGQNDPRPMPVAFLNPDEGIRLLLVGGTLLVLHGRTAWLADPRQPDDARLEFEGATSIDGGPDDESFVIWTGRRWSLYDLAGQLLETGRTGAGARPGRIDGRTYSIFRDLTSATTNTNQR